LGEQLLITTPPKRRYLMGITARRRPDADARRASFYTALGSGLARERTRGP